MARPSKRFFPEYESHEISGLASGWLRVGNVCWSCFCGTFPLPHQYGWTLLFIVGAGELVFPPARTKGLACFLLLMMGRRQWWELHTFLSGRQTVSLFHCLWNARGAPITVPNPHKFQYTWFSVLFFYHRWCRRPRSRHKHPVVPTWSCHSCCHGKAIRNPFSHGDDVWQNAVALEAPEVRAQPSKSCLHLMGANPKWWEIFKKCRFFWLSDLFTFIFPFSSSMASSQPRSLPFLYDYGRSTF